MKFSIWELLLVIVIVALAVGRWMHVRANAAKLEELENTIQDYQIMVSQLM